MHYNFAAETGWIVVHTLAGLQYYIKSIIYESFIFNTQIP